MVVLHNFFFNCKNVRPTLKKLTFLNFRGISAALPQTVQLLFMNLSYEHTLHLCRISTSMSRTESFHRPDLGCSEEVVLKRLGAAKPLLLSVLNGPHDTKWVQQGSHKSEELHLKGKTTKIADPRVFLNGEGCCQFFPVWWRRWCPWFGMKNERWFYIMETFVGWRVGARLFSGGLRVDVSLHVPPLCSSPAATLCIQPEPWFSHKQELEAS